MDTTIEAGTMEATAVAVEPKVFSQVIFMSEKALRTLVSASFVVPSISGHSISAVAPDALSTIGGEAIYA